MKKSILLIITLFFSLYTSAHHIELISRTMDGKADGNSSSRNIDISDDSRYIVFTSRSPDIVENDTNLYTIDCRVYYKIPAFDVFRYDRTNKEIIRISLNGDQKELSIHDSMKFSMSADGQKVVSLNDMLSGQGWVSHVYDTDTSYRLFPKIDLGEDRFKLSGDGEYLVYYQYKNIYVLDMETGENNLITKSQDGRKSDQSPKHYPAISYDGQCISYISHATDVTKEATEGLFIRDRNTNEDKMVFPLNGHSASNLQFTRDANDLFFSTTAPLVTAQEKPSGIYTYNLQTEKTNPISLPDYNGVTLENIDKFSINSNGRYIVFTHDLDLFRYNLQTKKLFHLLKIDTIFKTDYVNVCGFTVDMPQEYRGEINISADGKFVVFTTNADLLVPEDTNSRFDAYLLEVEEESTADNWQVFE